MTHDELLLFGERLRNRRNALGLTQELAAEKADISLRFYQMLERGEKSVSVKTLVGLGRALTISIDYLLFGDFSSALENPLDNVLNDLSSQQREDALKILRLYAKACKE